MQYWLIKSEPNQYSWDDFCHDKETIWDGVKNYQAINNMKKMKIGDLSLFYHSGKEKAIMGVAAVNKEFYIHEDYGALVNFKFHSSIKNRITLSDIKNTPILKNMAMIKQPRLSVSPVTNKEWKHLIQIL